MTRICTVLVPLFALPSVGSADAPLLLQKPTVNKTHVVFVYADDLWIVELGGGDARRLTTGAGLETDPAFSPDGTEIAFTGEYEGNLDVYTMPATGGVPRRLTYHPGPDHVVGWTPDGKHVVFRSARTSHSRMPRLFTLAVEAGHPTELLLPMAEEGSFSPDAKLIAYVPFSNRSMAPGLQTAWKRYRGGTASPIWIADLADSAIEKLPREKSNDSHPMWVDNHIYFLSDRNGPVTLFAYDRSSRQVEQVIENKGLDIKSASAGPDKIVYEQFGSLHLFDVSTKRTQPLKVRVNGDLSGVRPRFVKVAKKLRNAALSPTGARTAFEARGEILTVPAEKGDARNLTNTPGVVERDPAWAPDGQSIAYFSDGSGEYQLHIRPQTGLGDVKKFDLGESPSFYYSPVWSPDGKKISYTDKRHNYWYLDLDNGRSTKIDTHTYWDFARDGPATWSPDSRWLAYTKQLKNYLYAVFVYSIDTGKRHQITDGMSDARHVVFDKSGKYLFFTASTDAGPSFGPGMSALRRSVTRSVYVAILHPDLPSPLVPESDEEKGNNDADDNKDTAKDDKKDKQKQDKTDREKKEDKPEPVRIEPEDIDQRILALQIPAKNYIGLRGGTAGVLYLLEGPVVNNSEEEADDDDAPPPVTLHKFDLEKRKHEKLLDEVRDVKLSDDGRKLLYRQQDSWHIVAADEASEPNEKELKLEDVVVHVDPRTEWRQMYREVWRIERDFLYDPGFHGLDLKAAEKTYAAYLPGIGSRRDLNYLFEEMLGELTLGHVFVTGGDSPEVKGPKGGLLGADFKVENGRYRFARILRGENWNPKLRAPLTQPGARVKEGEYLLAVNGREVRSNDDLDSYLEAAAEKATVLRVGPNPNEAGSREVTVVPIESEAALRHLAWVDANRRKVDQLSGGRVAYIYVPDTAFDGYARFNRYFFSQAGKEGAVIDERFNEGGLLADHVVDLLRQPLRSLVAAREGLDTTFPQGAVFGPKVMIINEMAGSGGDAMPYFFRQSGIGPLVGKRTWGGLVGTASSPALIDGGIVTAPSIGLYFPNGQWEVENVGVSPDIEVELDPKLLRAGRDPQLEKAVEVVLDELKKNPPSRPARPAYPNYHKRSVK